MPRRARLALAGVPWHIIQRGNNRGACFRATSDYLCYLETLHDQAKRHACRIHAYVLMTNHVHLLLTPLHAAGPGMLMKHLGQRYVQYFNRTHGRTGTLWEGRYRSCLAGDSAYVLACYRYIELNPVRAGMVRRPQDYPWSSYHANAEGGLDPLVAPHEDYQGLGHTDELRRSEYRRLIATQLAPGLIEDIRRATQGNYVVGPESVQNAMSEALQRRVTPGSPGRPKKPVPNPENVVCPRF
jgi:putative transposase